MIDYRQLEIAYGLEVYPRRDVVLVEGRGAVVRGDDGREYIDCVGGHGVAAVGHCNEAVVKAVQAQVERLITCSGVFYNDMRSRFLERLVSIAPDGLSRGFLCNSGTEAVEAALKFSRLTTGKTDFVCAMRGFHGRTLGALSATYNPKYREEFLPLVPGFGFVPYNHFQKLSEAVTSQTAGVILEPVQGEGGVFVGDREYFQRVRELCDQRGILLIVDEVQTGFGRTGRMFAVEHMGIVPDIMCLAKAVGGGVPMGVVLCSSDIVAPVGRHGSTFGGNPLACAAGLAAIDFMVEQQLPLQAAEKGRYLLEALRRIESDKIREVRGLGLMVGIELREKVKPYIEALVPEGVLAMPAGATVLRLLPPLVISYPQLDIVIEKIEKVLNAGKSNI